MIQIETRTLASGRILAFDREEHRYAIAEAPVPGIHRLLKRHELIEETPPPWVDFGPGSRVHAAAEADVAGTEEELREALSALQSKDELGAVMAARAAREKLEIAVEGAELLNGSDTYWYATKSDIVGYAGAARLVANYKTGTPEPWHGVQLHLEALLVEPAPLKLLGIYLKPDGTFKVEDYFRDRAAARVARSIAATQGEAFAWRMNHAR